ncbi:MAG: hypothetical protein GWO07_05970 [Candidatus Dadabacteria bacterium]|nr:hypothetical protein [Candidatus Dadabacteria bacterium]NIS08302.1 hypothetical protein [Candidatus Dadabacteria bacterium]NIV41650.1 hypothetical protein [Candidatus Dadabacteria bacterium]NIY21821.1 hypothetical protein [Candidatus Dadabacteria bacterium]
MNSKVTRRDNSCKNIEDRYRVLLDINNAIISYTDLDELLKEVAAKLNEIFFYDVSTITLFDPEKNKLMMTAFGKLHGQRALVRARSLHWKEATPAGCIRITSLLL